MSQSEPEAGSYPIEVGADPKRGRVASTLLLYWNDTTALINVCFLLAIIAGGLSEWAGSELFAVLAMVTYFIIGMTNWQRLHSVERFADSIYYQGFILTLFALMLALTGRGSHSLTSDEIIKQFGIAITTTFVGMTARIVIIQFLTTTTDVAEKITDDIARYAEKLNAEIARAITSFREVRDTLEMSAVDLSTDLEKQTKAAVKNIEDGLEASVKRLSHLTEETVNKLDGAVQDIVKRIKALGVPTEALEGLRDDLAALRATLDDANRAITEASKRTKVAADQSKESLDVTGDTLNSISNLGSAARSMVEHLSALSSALDRGVAKVGTDIGELGNNFSELVKGAKADLIEYNGALTESAQLLTDAIRDARNSNA